MDTGKLFYAMTTSSAGPDITVMDMKFFYFQAMSLNAIQQMMVNDR
jgi:hypothetical protein